MASNKMNAVEEESYDLSHCCVCFEEFDDGERKPKFLSCHHTLCLTCVEAIAQGINISCPACKTVSYIQGEPERLATNMYALNIIQLKKNAVKSGQLCWCLVCDAAPQSTCQGRHIVVDVMKDVAELKSGLAETKTQVTNHLNEAVAKREQTQEHLQVLMAQNSSCIQKLRLKMQQTAGTYALQYLVSSREAVGLSSIKKRLDIVVNEAKQESQEAGRVLHQVIAISEVPMVNEDAANQATGKRRRQDDETERPIPIRSNGAMEIDGASASLASHSGSVRSSRRGFSVERLNQTQAVHCQNLTRRDSGIIRAIEFSDDGSLLVSGGDGDRPVLIWRMDQVLDRTRLPVPSVLKVQPKDFTLFSLAISSDNSRIFIGGRDQFVYIHDTQTTELRNEVTHRSHDVYAIALQPGNSIGSVFAAACQTHEKGGTVKIFDTRRSLLDPVIQMESRDDMLTSVMFSPVEPTLIASSWKSNGTQLHDIRYKNMPLVTFQGNDRRGAKSARFDRKGARLLCSEIGQSLSCHNLPTLKHPTASGKMLLSALGYTMQDESQKNPNSSIMKSPCCYAGANDELVVGASNNNNIYIWSAPPSDGDERRQVKLPLRVLRGHHDVVRSVRYSVHNDVLASCGDEGIVKLWSTE